jgi:hypothetical protein
MKKVFDVKNLDETKLDNNEAILIIYSRTKVTLPIPSLLDNFGKKNALDQIMSFYGHNYSRKINTGVFLFLEI